MRIATLHQLLAVVKVVGWFRESGLRKKYNSGESTAAFPFSGTEADLSSKLHMSV